MATNSATPSKAVVQLAEAIMRTTMFTTGRLVTVAALVVAVVGLGLAQEPSKTDSGGTKPPAPKTKAEPVTHQLYATRDGRLYSVDPDGSNEQRMSLSEAEDAMTAQPSPDGRSLAHWHTLEGKEPQSTIVITDRHGKPIGESVSFPMSGGYRSFCWSPDGNQLHVSQSSAKADRNGVEHYTVDVKARKVKTLETLRGHLVTDWSRDGKYFLTTRVGEAEEWEPKSIHLMNMDGTEHKQLAASERYCAAMGLSPDGTRALCVLDGKLAVVTVADPKHPVFVEGIADDAVVTGSAWSPDGKRIAYCTGTFQFLEKEQLQKLESVLVVADPTGKDAKVIRTVKGESFNSVFWR
jgi:Tol biopolymer transport system component